MKKIRLKFKRKMIGKNIRLGLLVIFGILIILSAYVAIGAYQQPTYKTEKLKVSTVSYSHSGFYDFQVHIIENSLYEDTNTLIPGEKTLFKKLIDSVDGSYTYRFKSDKEAQVSGLYNLEAKIETDLWSKKYFIESDTPFVGNEYTIQTINFPLNTTIFQEIVNTIEDETGVSTQTPTLILKYTTLLDAKTASGEIKEAFSHSIDIPLRGNLLEFQGNLAENQPGSLDTFQTITTSIDTSNEKTAWTVAIILFLILFFVLALFTSNEISLQTPGEKIFKKIQKKYGDWIVEAEKLPKTDTKIISMKSFDDILKISEELGKPVIHYKTTTANPGTIHTFYVFDEEIHYMHVLPKNEKITKIAICPNCGQKIECEGTLGKKVNVKCPNCDNKGKITLTKTSRINPFRILYSRINNTKKMN
jgi:hypothetical protein